MSTLLLKLAAPLQSWGVASRFITRDTAKEPTKSGVVGLLAAALGRSRTENPDGLRDLNELIFGVRVDQPGTLLYDWHTAHSTKGESFISHRYYLADAVFLVGLEGEENFLKELATALDKPVFPLYLGRRSCPPADRLVLGIKDMPLRQALADTPWQASEWHQRKVIRQSKKQQISLNIVCDAQENEPGAFLQRDLPISFSQKCRQYGFRMVVDIVNAVSVPTNQSDAELITEHDALDALERI